MKMFQVPEPSGDWAIVCGKRVVLKRCAECGQPAQYMCDWWVAKGRRCDKSLCEGHAEQVSKNRDLCPDHVAVWDAHPGNPANKKKAR